MRIRYDNWLFDGIARELGDDKLDRLVETCGGVCVNVPQSPNANFAELVGPEVAAFLCRERGGEKVYVGSAGNLARKRQIHARNSAIITSNDTVSGLARRHGLSSAQIRRIKRRAAER